MKAWCGWLVNMGWMGMGCQYKVCRQVHQRKLSATSRVANSRRKAWVYWKYWDQGALQNRGKLGFLVVGG